MSSTFSPDWMPNWTSTTTSPSWATIVKDSEEVLENLQRKERRRIRL